MVGFLVSELMVYENAPPRFEEKNTFLLVSSLFFSGAVVFYKDF